MGNANLNPAGAKGRFCGLKPGPSVRYGAGVPMADMHHETVFFSGHVQGVGFRYAALQVAKEFEVAGLVRNLTDGRVLVEVEGETEEVAAFLVAVEERMHGYIRKTERTARTAPPRFTGFGIQ